ncbi:UNVERIFIED_CONTAM: DUF421 domain-containing protein [Halobacillus marinus]
MSTVELILRLLLAFTTLLLLTRLMGRKEISQMTFFNFVSAISVGTIGASLAIDSTLSVRNGIIALLGWSVFTVLLGYLDLKSKPIREVMNGQPIILIKDGKIEKNALKKARLDLDALRVLLRKKNAFAVAEVDMAVFEIDGTVSVLKYQQNRTATKRDTGTPPIRKVYPAPTTLIADGRKSEHNLKELGITEQWLDARLADSGVQDIKNVYYAEVQEDGQLHVDCSE